MPLEVWSPHFAETCPDRVKLALFLPALRQYPASGYKSVEEQLSRYTRDTSRGDLWKSMQVSSICVLVRSLGK